MSKLKSYNIANKEDFISFIQKCYHEDELDSYISDKNFDKPLKDMKLPSYLRRLGMEDDVKGELIPLLVYVDQDDIYYARL